MGLRYGPIAADLKIRPCVASGGQLESICTWMYMYSAYFVSAFSILFTIVT